MDERERKRKENIEKRKEKEDWKGLEKKIKNRYRKVIYLQAILPSDILFFTLLPYSYFSFYLFSFSIPFFYLFYLSSFFPLSIFSYFSITFIPLFFLFLPPFLLFLSFFVYLFLLLSIFSSLSITSFPSYSFSFYLFLSSVTPATNTAALNSWVQQTFSLDHQTFPLTAPHKYSVYL